MRRSAVVAMTVAVLCASSAAQQPPRPQLFEITLGPEIKTPVSGRLIIQAMQILPLPEAPPAAPGRAVMDQHKLNAAGVPNAYSFAMSTASLWPEQARVHFAAYEIGELAPGKSITVNADQISWPTPFSQLPAGDYAISLLLDVDHNFNADRFAPGDYNSTPVRVTLPGAAPPRLEIMRGPLNVAPPTSPLPPAIAAMGEHVRRIEVDSPLLSAFHGKPVKMRAQVVLPSGYETSGAIYPVVYNFQYYASTGLGMPQSDPRTSVMIAAGGRGTSMAEGYLPPMIHVMPEMSADTGAHMWADSANNGPWSSALVQELVPYIEKEFRADARPKARFLVGDQSGSWPALWQQVKHPRLFGGVWVNQLEMASFGDFMRTDITAKGANVFRNGDGSPKMMIRNNTFEQPSPNIALPPRLETGAPMVTTQSFEKMERVRGETGGRIWSQEAIFSPRGLNGAPMPMFNRATGDVDPVVADYWSRNYDVARIIAANWTTLKPDLDGKIHVTGLAIDRYYETNATRRLEGVLNGLGAKSEFAILDSHMSDRDFMTPAFLAMEKIAHPDSTFAPKRRVGPYPRIKLMPPAEPITLPN